MSRLAFALPLLFALACGGSSKPAPAPAAPAPAAPAAAPSEVTCEDACTEYGSCDEEVNGGEFSGGGECVERCEEARDAFLACIAAAADCAATLKC